MFILFVHILSLLLPFVLGQSGIDFSVPAGWRKPTSNLTRNERNTLAQAVIDSLTPLFNASDGQIDTLQYTQSANLICAFALHDMIANNNTNEAATANHLETLFQVHPGYYLPTDPVNWALGAINAYRAYKEQYLLDIAASVWQNMSVFMVTPQDAANGAHPKKNVSISSDCDGASPAGGVFYLVDNPLNTDVNGETVGGFMALSAHLYEATNDSQYGKAAELSAEFIKSHLYNGTIIIDTITLNNCAKSELPVTYNSGFYIDGLSVWANVTRNGTWTEFLQGLVASTIKFPTWTGGEGIITEGPATPNDALTDGFGIALKAIFVRGLYEAWSRADPQSDYAKLIESYVTVQFNALLDLASAPGTNQYSSRWLGPPTQNLEPWGQLAALDVLNSAMGMAPKLTADNATSTIALPGHPLATSTGTAAAQATIPKIASKVPLIVGVTVGAVAILILILGSLLLWRWRGRRSRYRDDGEEPHPLTVEPFNTYSSTMSQAHMASTSHSHTFGSASRPSVNTSTSTSALQTQTWSDPSRSLVLSPMGYSVNNRLEKALPAEPDRASAGPSATVPLAPRMSTSQRTDDEEETVPALVQRLNRALAKLPPGGVTGGVDEEEPPEYES